MIPNVVWLRIGLCFGLLGSLVAGQLPAARAQSDPAGFDTVINAPPTIIGADDSIGSNTQLNVFDDEDVEVEVGTGFNLGSASGDSTNVELNLFSGVVDSTVRSGFSANFGSTTNILGGSLGSTAEANSGSVVNISGGTVGTQFRARAGSVVNISGGTVGYLFDAVGGSVVNVSGGSVGPNFDAFAGSELNVSGGTFGGGFEAFPGSNVTFIGGEFLLNGEPPTDPASVTLSGSDVLTGTLQDGSVFVFSSRDDLSGVTLQTGTLPANNVLPIVVGSALDAPPTGLRAGQSLTLRGDGALGPDFAAVDATLNIEGGSMASNVEVVSSTVTISDGVVPNLTAFSGSEINVSGGDVANVWLFESSAEISGVALDFLQVGFGSVVDFTDGTVGPDQGDNRGFGLSHLIVDADSTVNISGGRFGIVNVLQDGEFNLFVTEAFIDGAPIEGLSPGETRTISERGQQLLSGVLADGSEFLYLLNPLPLAVVGDTFDLGSTVTVTLAPAVPEVILGDVNQDAAVNFEDIPSFIEVLQAGIFLPAADVNQDGEVNFEDIPRFVEILQAQ